MRVIIVYDIKIDPFKPWTYHVEFPGLPPFTGNAATFDNVWQGVRDLWAQANTGMK